MNVMNRAWRFACAAGVCAMALWSTLGLAEDAAGYGLNPGDVL